ncbi:MAG: S8 family serine peptidase [Caulobacteraceae bacterium]|nr:S8 family serine peptidase [Caulobacteraceae bacterium]
MAAASAAVLSTLGTGASAQSGPTENSWNLRLIGAGAAHDRGYTGAGVTVGVIDSGLDATHPEFRGRIAYSVDGATGEPVTEDPGEHGTHVSGIIAAARDGRGTQGVAFGARLAILGLAGEDEAEIDAIVGDLVRAGLQNGARVFNNSWGFDFYIGSASGQTAFRRTMVEQTAGYREAVAQGAIVVFSTGNESQLQPNVQAGLPFYAPDLKPNWLAVTAVGPSGTLAGYANQCGRAAEWCLAAPGGDFPDEGQTAEQTMIVSTLPGGGYGSMAGTSMAAPHVTGAVAIALEMFPEASGAELTRLTLATATDVGAAGIDVEYGWGLLNIENLAMTRDAVAASTFANGFWAANRGQVALIRTLDSRMSAEADGGAWGAVLAARADHDATGSANGADADSLGFVTGFDLAASGDATLGLAFSYVRTEMEEAGGRNEATVEALGLSGYGAVRRGTWFARGASGVEVVNYTFSRGSILGAAGTVLEGQGLTGRANGDGYSAWVDGRIGVAVPFAGAELRPFVHGRIQRVLLDAFEETADIFSLSVREIDQTRVEAGPGVEMAFAPVAVGPATLSGEVGARYAFSTGDDTFETPAAFLGSPVPGGVGSLGDAATVSGTLRARFGERLEAGIEGFWSVSDRADQGGLAIGARLRF